MVAKGCPLKAFDVVQVHGWAIGIDSNSEVGKGETFPNPYFAIPYKKI